MRAEGLNSGLTDINQVGSANYSKEAKGVREDFRDYFISEEGSLHCAVLIKSDKAS